MIRLTLVLGDLTLFDIELLGATDDTTNVTAATSDVSFGDDPPPRFHFTDDPDDRFGF